MEKPQTEGANDVVKESPVIVEKVNRAGLVTLNRPKALNALTIDMIATMEEFYNDCAADHHIYGMVLQSADDKSFCVGGDLKQILSLCEQGVSAVSDYFRTEYTHNWTLERFHKPHIALMNGPTFGGGVGISLYGTHRVAGENYSFAMPENRLGIFPDVGSIYRFARLPNSFGLYLALTGERLQPADAYSLNLLTHCIPQVDFDEIKAAMVESDPIDPVLENLHQDPGEGALSGLQDLIDKVFSEPSISAVVAALEKEAHGLSPTARWAEKTLDDLKRAAPLSLAITFRHYHEAKKYRSLREMLIQDFRIAVRLAMHANFKTGVSDMLIEKTGKPQWDQTQLTGIDDTLLDQFFKPFTEEEVEELSLVRSQDDHVLIEKKA